MLNRILILIVSCLFLISCSEKKDPSWIVKINDNAITQDQLQTGLINLSSDLQQQIAIDSQPQFVLQQLIRSEVFFQEAIKNQLDENQDYQNYVSRLSNQFEYQKKQMLVELFVREKIDSTITVSDQEVATIYDTNKDTLFSQFEQRSISHIVVKTKKEADALYKQLQAGKNFNALAKTKSIDVNTAANNGKITGYFRKENLNKEFSNPIFSIKNQGQYSKPVSSQAGFHIFRLDDIQVVPERSLSDVKEFIKNQIYLKKRQDEIAKFLESIKDYYTITQNDMLNKEKEVSAKPESDSSDSDSSS